MRIACLTAMLLVATPAVAGAAAASREPDQPQRRETMCLRPIPLKGPRTGQPDPRRYRPGERPECRQAPAYPEVVDPTPVFIL
ncbi:hypothetical protein ABDK56_01050 [Sphingomonas sp. ASV193]|uniref:hypothetical protein n=1 Tax=Sphingomonas sp. ASV193 TaxID=3144405 RepID=UPI0032E8BF46